MIDKVTSLYVHVPFCSSICSYCDFAKVLYFKDLANDYLKSLEKEILLYKIDKPLKTVYIGGGTPTSLDDEQFSFLLSLLDPYIDENILEYTVEANPESLTLNKLKIMKEHHVNRLSLGVESTDDRILKYIGRQYTFEDVKKVVGLAKKEGFDNISIDLILGLPQVSNEMLLKDINNILSLDINHISAYSLTVHENTKFYLEGIKEKDDDEMREKYDIINKILENHGYLHYEISSWTKDDKFSKHNLVYWKDEQYYGLGLNASGYINNIRYTNTRNLYKYNKGLYKDYEEVVSKEDDLEYYLMLNLRTIFGIDLDEFKEKFGFDFLNRYELNEYFVIENNHVHLTYPGMMILDNILINLLD